MTVNDPSTDRGVPLKITVKLPYEQGFTRFSVRVEGLAQGARLSIGVNNGDGTWSLSPDQLPGLRYLPAENDIAMRLLMVRVIGFKCETAETVTAFSLLVAPLGAATDDEPTEPTVVETLAATTATQINRAPLETSPGDMKELLAVQIANARRKWTVEAECNRRATEAALTADVDRRLAATIAHVEATQTRAIAAATETFENDMRRRVLEAKTAFEREMSRRLTEAERRWRDAELLRSQVTRQRWQSESHDALDLSDSPAAGLLSVRKRTGRRRWLGPLATHGLIGAIVAALVILAPAYGIDRSARIDNDPIRRITVPTASLHHQPATVGDVIGIASPGMDLHVVATRGDWIQVAVPDLDVVGWIESSQTKATTDSRRN